MDMMKPLCWILPVLFRKPRRKYFYRPRDNIIKTTPLTSILGGITRDPIITPARNLQLRSSGTAVYHQDELYTAENFLQAPLPQKLTPIREADHRALSEPGHRGPVTKHLQERIFAIVKGENPKYSFWPTKIQVLKNKR